MEPANRDQILDETLRVSLYERHKSTSPEGGDNK